MRQDVAVFVPVDAVWPEIDPTLDSLKNYLKNISRTDALFTCARLNLKIGALEDEHVEVQQSCANRFLTADELERLNRFVAEHGGITRVHLVFRGQVLELMRWVAIYCTDLPGDGETFADPRTRQDFMKALLIASELWSDRVFRQFSVTNGVDMARRSALGPIRKSLEAHETAPEVNQSLGRGWGLFSRYLPVRCRTFEQLFIRSCGLTLEDFYSCAAALITNGMHESAILRPGSDVNITPGGRQLLDTYLASFSTSPEEMTQVFSEKADPTMTIDYRLMRDKPIIGTRDGR